ncbi:hypothetical protein Q6375_10070 [Clostridium septicum]|uniref:hypothetical protein n=1 Tax=Clostridium septicum TaxID=1504 RepID=UPI00272DEC26|nr:hypothetical protein [Clostridium septicum]WLF68334.1 hypothetical protein Q6375_10070 [Clostridium septicum]
MSCNKNKYPNNLDESVCESDFERPTRNEKYEDIKENNCVSEKTVFSSCHMPECPNHSTHENGCDFDSVETISFKCCDIKERKNINVNIACTGRILNLNVFLKDVCVKNTVAVGILVCDKESDKIIGFKVKKVFIKPENNECCRDFFIGKFTFIIPEEDLCDNRLLKVKVLAQYTDIDWCK